MHRNIYKLQNIIFWKCSFCESDIEINYSKKATYKNFLCDRCLTDYNLDKNVDEKIINNFKEYIIYTNQYFNTKYEVILKKLKKNQKL